VTVSGSNRNEEAERDGQEKGQDGNLIEKP